MLSLSQKREGDNFIAKFPRIEEGVPSFSKDYRIHYWQQYWEISSLRQTEAKQFYN